MVPSAAVDKLAGGDSERLLRACFDLPVIGISIVDSNMRFVEANDRFCDILGFSRDELLRLSWPEITHPDDLKAPGHRHFLVPVNNPGANCNLITFPGSL